MKITKTVDAARPRLEARRLAFLAAATQVFLEKGYANATLDDIIARSGGSRQTLYSLFGGKQGVFEAIIAERSAEIFHPFDAIDLLDRAPDEMLTKISVQFLLTVLSPEALGTYRLLVAEGTQMRELVERFWDVGPGRMRALLGDYFQQQVIRGKLRLRDTEQAANQFLGTLLGNYPMQCLLGLREVPGREEIEVFAGNAVDWFLNGCRVR
jgi:TetR/AcrR family transcriptional regulator, mexJK operon transcriptional repressor